MIEAIAFDLDGTLLDSMGMWHRITRTYVEAKGKKMTHDLEQRLTTSGTSQGFIILKEELGIEDSLEVMEEAFTNLVLDQYLNHVAIKDGAREALEGARKRGYGVSLATASNSSIVKEVLKGKNMTHYFDFVTTCDLVGLAKNDPAFYHHLAQAHRVEKGKLLLIDDAPYALRAAKEAGLKCLAIYDEESKDLWEAGYYEDFQAIHHLDQVLDYLDS